VFVCHSMGGIVVRKLIVERRDDFIERKIQLGLFLVASPSLGSQYANWLSVLAKAMGQIQVPALTFDRANTWLQSLDKEFINLKESGRLKITGKELIEDKFLTPTGSRLNALVSALFRRPVVDRFTGARYFGEPYKVPQSDHWSIAKPENRTSIQH